VPLSSLAVFVKLHISERAYIVGAASQELEAGSKQAVPITGRISEETTGNGFNEFYDALMEDYGAKDQGLLDGYSEFYAWHEQPEYTLPGRPGSHGATPIRRLAGREGMRRDELNAAMARESCRLIHLACGLRSKHFPARRHTQEINF
jgi:hypothetical protein